MAPSLKLSRSGYKIVDVYSELDIALLASDHVRACSLAAELSCSGGGQARAVVAFLINRYCARCVNSSRAQMGLLRSSLAHTGDGTSGSPGDSACQNIQFRRGLCTLTLLVASASKCHKEGGRDVTGAFASVPRAESIPNLGLTIEALRQAISHGDARAVSSIIRAIPDDAWCKHTHTDAGMISSAGCPAEVVRGLPDIQRLRASHRRDPVWDVWRLACEVADSRGVLEYVGDCLHAFAWGFTAPARRARIHLLWYAFLVIIKGSPRGGPHPVEPYMFEQALTSIDAVFEDILTCAGDGAGVHTEPTVAPPSTTKAAARARAEAEAEMELDARTSYLLTVIRPDQGRVWEVEREREEVNEGRRLLLNDSEGGASLVKTVVVRRGHAPSGQATTAHAVRVHGHPSQPQSQPHSYSQSARWV